MTSQRARRPTCSASSLCLSAAVTELRPPQDATEAHAHRPGCLGRERAGSAGPCILATSTELCYTLPVADLRNAFGAPIPPKALPGTMELPRQPAAYAKSSPALLCHAWRFLFGVTHPSASHCSVRTCPGGKRISSTMHVRLVRHGLLPWFGCWNVAGGKELKLSLPIDFGTAPGSWAPVLSMILRRRR
jgi:hypothetical protein